jgi:hypothetical protein
MPTPPVLQTEAPSKPSLYATARAVLFSAPELPALSDSDNDEYAEGSGSGAASPTMALVAPLTSQRDTTDRQAKLDALLQAIEADDATAASKLLAPLTKSQRIALFRTLRPATSGQAPSLAMPRLPLSYAAYHNACQVLRLMLEPPRARLDAVEPGPLAGRTALYWAARGGAFDAMHILSEEGLLPTSQIVQAAADDASPAVVRWLANNQMSQAQLVPVMKAAVERGDVAQMHRLVAEANASPDLAGGSRPDETLLIQVLQKAAAPGIAEDDRQHQSAVASKLLELHAAVDLRRFAPPASVDDLAAGKKWVPRKAEKLPPLSTVQHALNAQLPALLGELLGRGAPTSFEDLKKATERTPRAMAATLYAKLAQHGVAPQSHEEAGVLTRSIQHHHGHHLGLQELIGEQARLLNVGKPAKGGMGLGEQRMREQIEALIEALLDPDEDLAGEEEEAQSMQHLVDSGPAGRGKNGRVSMRDRGTAMLARLNLKPTPPRVPKQRLALPPASHN